MKSLKQEFDSVSELIKKHDKILIISHQHPDADTIGANLALSQLISGHFGKKTVSACADVLPVSLMFLSGSEDIQMKTNMNEFPLVITVDCSSEDQVKFSLNKKSTIINIDHHASNTKFGQINIVDPESASTTEIIFRFFELLNVPLTPSIATYLLAGLYNDTGSFMHSNTSADTYLAASKLLEAGASYSRIVQNLFRTKSIGQLKLWGKVLLNAKMTKNGTLASKVTSQDFKETDTSPPDLSGVINYLNAASESSMSILLAEDMKGNVKGSLRSGEKGVDVSEVCGQLGGGGHKKAAGFTIPGKIVSEEVWKIE